MKEHTSITKALSVRAPWWWFILHGKDIENRGARFPRTVFGPIWLHASKWWDDEEVMWDFDSGLEMANKAGLKLPEPDWDYICNAGGKIVGSVEVISYVDWSDSPWFVGETGIRLRNPQTLANPVPVRGMLGYFTIPEGLIGDAA